MSKQKKPRNKKYVQKQTLPFGGLSLIAKHVLSADPLSEDQRRNAGLSLHMSIVMLELGFGEPSHFNALVFNANISRCLNDMSILNTTDEHEVLVQAALAALWYAKHHAQKVDGPAEYSFTVDPVGLQALKDWSHLHEAQIDIVTQGELDIARHEMNRRIAAGIGFNQEHAEEAWQKKESPTAHIIDLASHRKVSSPDLPSVEASSSSAASLQSSFA